MSSDPYANLSHAELVQRIQRLEKSNDVLARRVERQIDAGATSFDLFETARTLEAKVYERTHKLEELQRALLRMNEDLIGALAEIEETSRSKLELLANISHEIRTPMNGILGMLELLVDRAGAEAIGEDLMIIQQSAKGLLALLDDFLDFSKSEAGALVLEQEPFCLIDLAEEVVDLFTDRAHAKQLRIFSEIQAGCEYLPLGDPLRLRQVLCNLVGNAVKFTESGYVRLEVNTRNLEGRVALTIRVEDSGIGIAQESLATIFEPFRQAETSTSRRFGGTGLGLSICKSIVERMDGRIRVHSDGQTGSTFELELELPASRKKAPRPCVAGAMRRCLVLDLHDGETVQGLIDKLEHCGLEVKVAKSLEACVQLVAAESFDLGMLDLRFGAPMSKAQMQGLQQAAPSLAWLGLVRRGEAVHHDRVVPELRTVDLPLRLSSLRRELNALRSTRPSAASKGPELEPENGTESLKSGSAKILIAEDNEINRLVALRTIRKLGYEVEAATNGIEAVAMAQQGAYDLILMDCQMPEMDGYDATRAIRELTGDIAHVPILALTANVLEGDRERCLDAGMSDYLAKPFDVQTLAKAIQALLPGA
jgi:two-component system sensor histidine kinase/response regulator